jgi:hypothetical protein
MDLKDLLSAGIGLFFSVIFVIIPPLANLYYKIDKNYRGLAMVGIDIIVGAAIFGLSCAGLFNWMACTKDGLMSLIRALLIIIASGQVTYMVTPENQTVKNAKAQGVVPPVVPPVTK